MWEGDKWEPPTSQPFCVTMLASRTLHIQCLCAQGRAECREVFTIWCWTQDLLDSTSEKGNITALSAVPCKQRASAWMPEGMASEQDNMTHRPNSAALLLLSPLSLRCLLCSICSASINAEFCFIARAGLALPKGLCITALSIKFESLNRLKRMKYVMHSMLGFGPGQD